MASPAPADVPVLFSSLGSASSAALLNTVVIGAVNVGSTLVAVMFSDKFGRRFLLIEGGIQCCLAMVSEAYWLRLGCQYVLLVFCLCWRWW